MNVGNGPSASVSVPLVDECGEDGLEMKTGDVLVREPRRVPRDGDPRGHRARLARSPDAELGIGRLPDRRDRRSRLDRRHSQIELESFALAGERQSDRMKQRLPLLARTVAHGGEHQLALLADEHDAACEADARVGLDARFERSVGIAHLDQRVAAIEPVRVRLHPLLAELVELGEPLGLFGSQAAATAVGVGRFGRFGRFRRLGVARSRHSGKTVSVQERAGDADLSGDMFTQRAISERRGRSLSRRSPCSG